MATKIVVIGGNGLIGTKLVKNLGLLGHDVVAARASGVDVLTGRGLAETMTGGSRVRRRHQLAFVGGQLSFAFLRDVDSDDS